MTLIVSLIRNELKTGNKHPLIFSDGEFGNATDSARRYHDGARDLMPSAPAESCDGLRMREGCLVQRTWASLAPVCGIARAEARGSVDSSKYATLRVMSN